MMMENVGRAYHPLSRILESAELALLPLRTCTALQKRIGCHPMYDRQMHAASIAYSIP